LPEAGRPVRIVGRKFTVSRSRVAQLVEQV